MIDVEEIKTKLVQDYRRLWINKHKFELNDAEVDVEDCLSKMEYIVDTLIFITGWSRDQVGEALASHISYIIDFDPQTNSKTWDLSKFDYVELQEDLPYGPLVDFADDQDCTEEYLVRNGFIIENNWVSIPAGTIMRFEGSDCNGWPEFSVRMKLEDFTLTFAGSPFKLKLI